MLTKGINRLISDAKDAGCKVTEQGCRLEITRPNKKLPTLVISPDGTAYRGDTDLSVCISIRTQKEMRKALGI